MKARTWILASAMAMFSISGCAYYQSADPHSRSAWLGLTPGPGAALDNHAEDLRERAGGYNENLREQQQTWDLSVQKMLSQPQPSGETSTPMTDVSATKGFKGVITNLSPVRVNIQIVNLRTRLLASSYFLDPGASEDPFLLPGTYQAIFYLGDRPTGKGWKFSVGAINKQVYRGKEVYWYVYFDPCQGQIYGWSVYLDGGQTIYCR